MSDELELLFERIQDAKTADEDQCLDNLIAAAEITIDEREAACTRAEEFINEVRQGPGLGMMDALLAEYGLGTDEGVALLRLSEALMRVPDGPTQDALIADKIKGADWKRHKGKSPSRLVNGATSALDLTAKFLRLSIDPDIPEPLRGTVRLASKLPIRVGVRRAVEVLAGRFIHGVTIDESVRTVKRAGSEASSFSFDMLGEAALTEADARKYLDAYREAIIRLERECASDDFRENDGISIKLSALHSRYEYNQIGRVVSELGERLFELALMAKSANMGLNIDAEEADRLEMSLMVIKRVLRRRELADWDGFGIVVQAYGKAAPHVIDWLYALAKQLDRKLMIRLVKGAYWDSEIKRAQTEGLADFPVYTRKAATDVSYLCCVKKLLKMSDRIYPQFAGHNAHTIASVLAYANEEDEFEFQRIHGMGEQLHENLLRRHGRICRVYAPVGNMRELLPYLARRILENGANSSFVNQIADTSWSPEAIAADPFEKLAELRLRNIRVISKPETIFGEDRKNSQGWDLHSPRTVEDIRRMRRPYELEEWNFSDQTGGLSGALTRIVNPADPSDTVGRIGQASRNDVDTAVANAETWENASAQDRAKVLLRASEIYEQRAGEIFALLSREAGKSYDDAVAELREAVDFLRYYACEAAKLEDSRPLGKVACVSPWNFPLAIFTGQCAAALAAGNAVLAKPAEQTPLTAALAVSLLHEAGIPDAVLQLLPGEGSTVGAQITSHDDLDGVAFTGSSETARRINLAMANSKDPSAPLIAETGGLNAMIADSTALPEQVIKDVIVSAFQSAGQRCSALRILYLQSDIEDLFLEMLFGAMLELKIGDPREADTDVGPLIDKPSMEKVNAHIDRAKEENRLIFQIPVPDTGNFVGPAVIRVGGVEDIKEEIFGPVLHVARYRSDQQDEIAERINQSGYGLTFGLHSRLDGHVKKVIGRINVGNIYVNRNQIGAVVGSQPFGGEGLSGTGPKAGGPDYVRAFVRADREQRKGSEPIAASIAPAEAVQLLLNDCRSEAAKPVRIRNLPGPTGETNQLTTFSRGTVLCLGPTANDAEAQAETAARAGCYAVKVAEGASGPNAVSGYLQRSELANLRHVDVVVLWSDSNDLRKAREALAARSGPIVPLVSDRIFEHRCVLERHVCIDTTAAGGNATLFASLN